MRKYGVENFIFEIIEGPIENYNERECYWIDYYNSYKDKNKGYNMTPGGEDPPILKGDNHPSTIFSDEVIKNIQNDLMKTTKSYQDISIQYNVSLNYLSMINRGIARKDENLNYPLRKNDNERKSNEIVKQISDDLLYTTLSIEKIAAKNNVDSNSVYKINTNQHINCDSTLHYPIRQPYQLLSYYLIESIIKDLQDDKLKLIDIQNKYKISKSFLSRFNNGKVCIQENLTYPIRSSKQRVYN